MANQEHFDILRQGVNTWNEWREEHREVRPDLRDADFRDADLRDVDLSYANLFNANLSGANLSGASFYDTIFIDANLSGTNLSGASLSGAKFSWSTLFNANLSRAHLNRADLSIANFRDADLRDADLRDANLSITILSNANLSGARLNNAILTRTNLSGANLDYARIGQTTFRDLDLRTVKGLETLKHEGPSTIGTDTILRSEGEFPKAFLRGTGLDDSFIKYVLSRKGTQYHSCFISYSCKDQAFAERLYADLQNKNVRCWYAPHDMKTGDRIRPRIHEQIWFNDKLLLILSESSVSSEWVDYEVETALARERKEKQDILFPIRLDDAVMESTTAWAAHIQDARHITDFTRWKEHDEYQKGLTRLLCDLKQDTVTF